MTQSLPIDDALPALTAALREAGRAVLQAPPGAGKTTRVPLAILQAGLVTGRIIMLEPRRLATRAAAERLASQLGEQPGGQVGYRMRGDAKTSSATRIEVVTEGILTRMIQSDPELTGVSAVIFDEFHERSLNADLGLALTWEIRQALRPDLMILVMSATLDTGPVAEMLDNAPVITSQGRSFPVTTTFLDKPLRPRSRIAAATADLTAKAVGETSGGVLVFLPGEGEIRQTESALNGRLPSDVSVRPLYGALPFAAQRAAIAPCTTGRKVVLATSIAETSLTIEDITVVIDAGQSRRARYDPGSGMSRLVTEKVSRAEATQRAGRAGRVAPGTCYKLWTKGEDGALAAFPPAEIEATDLAGLALEMAAWGNGDLAFLTAPPEGALAGARDLLQGLGALDTDNRITTHGRALAGLPLHPRLAHMLEIAGQQAAPVAAILAARDPLRGAPSDLALRLRALKGRYDGPGEVHHGSVETIRTEARRLGAKRPKGPDLSLAEQVALAYPDRIGLRRKGDDPRYVLSGGKGAVLDSSDPLAGQRLIVASDLDGNPREARIRQAVAISETEMRSTFGDQIRWENICIWSRRDRKVLARQQERLGALVLDDRNWPDAPPDAMAKAMCEGIRELGLRLSPAAQRFRARVMLLRQGGQDLPDMSDDALLEGLEGWLAPHLNGTRTAEGWKKFDALAALRGMLDWNSMQLLDRLAPAHFETPLGRKTPIDYDSDPPGITVRLQELFGVTHHPTVGKTPLRITLLSPGQKPVQTTSDLPGFWASSYEDVRKDMRGRYPRHPWPEDPTQADPTVRAKRRGS